MGVVLKVLVKKGPLGIYISITADPNQTGNVHYGNFGIGFLSNYHIGSFNLGVFTPSGFRIYGVYGVKVSCENTERALAVVSAHQRTGRGSE